MYLRQDTGCKTEHRLTHGKCGTGAFWLYNLLCNVNMMSWEAHTVFGKNKIFRIK